jgi:hypothetical protein
MPKKRKSGKEKRAARRERLQATCDKLEVPAVVAVKLLAGLIDEATIIESPERVQWREQYRDEVALLQSGANGAKKLKRHRAEQIAAAFGLKTDHAFAVLSGTITPGILEQQRLAQEKKRRAKEERERQEKERKRQDKWLAVAAATLQTQGIPEEMAYAAFGAYRHGKRWRLRSSASIDFDGNPAETGTLLWRRLLQKSEFDTPRDLITAWEQHRVWTVERLRQVQEHRLREANAGMLPERIAQLCFAEHIEDTLRTLFHLNHWAKARDRLLYVDRQGLYRVKARLLQEAFRADRVLAVTYVAGPADFDPFGEIWLELPLEYLQEAAADAQSGRDDPLFEKATRLYRDATGRAIGEGELDMDTVERFIRGRLDELRREAIATRRPIPVSELEALLFTPDTVPSMAHTQNGDYRWSRWTPDWSDLNESDLASLDPEWYSLVAFSYTSASARFSFYLLYRVSKRFVPEESLWQLKAGGEQREAGEFFGREITEEESLAHPVVELLERLGVEVSLVCPERLVDKEAYVEQREAERAERWAWQQFEEGQLDTDWDDDQLD